MPWVTKEGRSVEEARSAAVAESGLPEADLDIEVLNEGARGLFGLGGEPAVVRVRPKNEATDFRDAFRDDITPARDEAPREEPARTRERAVEPAAPVANRDDDEEISDEDRATLNEQQQAAAELGTEIVRGILERMNLEGEVRTRIEGGTAYIEIFGEEMGILIGRSGATLEALQEIVRAGIQRRLKTRQAVVVDVEAYWERRRKPQGSEARSESGGGGGRGGRGRGGGGGGGRGRSRGGRGRGRGGRGGGQQREVDGNVDGNVEDSEPEEIDGNQ